MAVNITSETEERIAAVYASRPRINDGSISRLCIELGVSAGTVSSRARRLGISLRSCPHYSKAERETVEANAHLSSRAIAARLTERGFNRSPRSVREFIRKNQIKSQRGLYTITDFALCMGVNPKTVRNWIYRGLLRFKNRKVRTDHDHRALCEGDIRKFLLSHPLAYDHKKADWVWLLNVITKGKVGVITRERRV